MLTFALLSIIFTQLVLAYQIHESKLALGYLVEELMDQSIVCFDDDIEDLEGWEGGEFEDDGIITEAKAA